MRTLKSSPPRWVTQLITNLRACAREWGTGSAADRAHARRLLRKAASFEAAYTAR